MEQLGVKAVCSTGSTHWLAWWQMWPSPFHPLAFASYPVRSGDQLRATVTTSVGSDTLRLTSSEGWSFQTVQTAADDAASAEWITSTPRSCETCGYDPLADFRTVHFSDAEAGVAGGPLESASYFSSAGSLVALNMTASDGAIMSRPGPLTSVGRAFAIAWVSA